MYPETVWTGLWVEHSQGPRVRFVMAGTSDAGRAGHPSLHIRGPLTVSLGLDWSGRPERREVGVALPEGLGPGTSPPPSSIVQTVTDPPGCKAGDTDPTSQWDGRLRFDHHFQSTAVLLSPFYRKGNRGSRTPMISVL